MAAEELEPVSRQPGLLQALVLQAQRFEMVLRAGRKQALSLELVQLLL
jgi:hypothetical protein